MLGAPDNRLLRAADAADEFQIVFFQAGEAAFQVYLIGVCIDQWLFIFISLPVLSTRLRTLTQFEIGYELIALAAGDEVFEEVRLLGFWPLVQDLRNNLWALLEVGPGFILRLVFTAIWCLIFRIICTLPLFICIFSILFHF